MKLRFLLPLFLAPLFVEAQITVNGSGDVGIGTTTPLGGRLDVYQATARSNAARFEVNNADTTVGFDYGIYLKNRNATNGNFASVVNWDANNNGNAWIQFINLDHTTPKGAISFVTRNGGSYDRRLYINEDGNVGVGTTNPNASVDIWKSYSAGADSLRFSYNDGSDYWMGVQPYVVGAGNVGYKFRTNNDTTTVDTLALTGAGNVGIGTTSPTAKLDIHAPNQTPAAFRMNKYYYLALLGNETTDSAAGISFTTKDSGGVGRTGFIIQNPDGALRLLTDSTDRFRVSANGDVGIGTTTPGHKLEVNGTVRATSFISDTTTYADFVFDEDYDLPSLSEVEAHIDEHGHLPDIPSEAEAMAHGIDLAAMQVKLLQKIEELTLHQIAQEKRLNAQSQRIEALETENHQLRSATGF